MALKHSRGFTLLELMITIAVLGILAAIALPSFSYLSRVTRVKSAATSFYLAMLQARSAAVKRNSPVTIAPVTSGSWQGGWTITDPRFATTDTRYLILTQESLKGVTVGSAVTSVVYMSSGRIQGGAAPAFSITYTQPGSNTGAAVARCVSAGPSGAPYMTKAICPPP